MKHKACLLLALLATLTTMGCTKQKTCRCSVLGTSTIRIIQIESGECDQFRSFSYHDELDSLHVERLICTDYEFSIDQKD